jgi:CTP synthase
MNTKYVIVTGGVLSSLGKGLTAASLALLLERQPLKIALQKMDPYLNVDPGTMSPYQHGEVYVTDDGAETDLDLGHYFRYSHSPLSRKSSITTGQIYGKVIERERQGGYLGKTVQVIPHITDEIKQRVFDCTSQNGGVDILIVEIGGTVGDIESLPFLEAMRQFRNEHPNDCINIHLTYVPYLSVVGEIKTKPTQHSVQMLREIGITPDIIICRCERSLGADVKEKISLFCNVPKESVIDEPDVHHSIYEVPLVLKEQKVDQLILTKLQLPFKEVQLNDWEEVIEKKKQATDEITIGIVGKYIQHKDAYKSIYESLEHAAIHNGCKLHLKLFESDKVMEAGHLKEEVKGCDGYLVPGGFGERGWYGKILTAKWARESKTPYFGICLGMQAMATEFTRNVLEMKDANSTEIDPNTPHPIVDLMESQKQIDRIEGSIARKAYGQDVIKERHRHRFELNTHFHEMLEEKGLSISGILENGHLAEIIEIKDHPWMVGVQFHPEFKSRLMEPHPLFLSFIQTVRDHAKNKT